LCASFTRLKFETFEKCSILFKFKAGENFNHRNTLSILRIALKLHFVQNVEPVDKSRSSGTQKLGKRGRFAKVSLVKRSLF
ncbi:MAG: hypothetical protein V3T59_03800, partial [Desulfobacterales bacterium]